MRTSSAPAQRRPSAAPSSATAADAGGGGVAQTRKVALNAKATLGKLRNTVDNIIAANASYAEEQRQAAIRASVRFAASDAVQAARAWSGDADDEDALVQSIAESFFNIVSQEVRSHAALLTRVKQAEAAMDFMSQQLERREVLAGEHRTEMLRELQRAHEQVRQLTERHHDVVEQLRVARARAHTAFSSFRAASPADLGMSALRSPHGSMSAAKRRSAMAAGAGDDDEDGRDHRATAALEAAARCPSPHLLEPPSLSNVQGLSQRMEGEWLAAVQEEEFHAREKNLQYEAEQKLRALQVKLKREQDVLVHRTNRRMEDTLKIETTKLENQVRLLQKQLARKDAEAEQQLQRERRRWESQLQRATDAQRLSARGEAERLSQHHERDCMALHDDLAHSHEAIRNLVLERERLRATVHSLSSQLEASRAEVHGEREKLRRERKEAAERLRDVHRRHNVEIAGLASSSGGGDAQKERARVEALQAQLKEQLARGEDLRAELLVERENVSHLKARLADLDTQLRMGSVHSPHVRRVHPARQQHRRGADVGSPGSGAPQHWDHRRVSAISAVSEGVDDDGDHDGSPYEGELLHGTLGNSTGGASIASRIALDEANAERETLRRTVTSLNEALEVAQQRVAELETSGERCEAGAETPSITDDVSLAIPAIAAEEDHLSIERAAAGIAEAEELLDDAGHEFEAALKEERQRWVKERDALRLDLAAARARIADLEDLLARQSSRMLSEGLADGVAARASDDSLAAGTAAPAEEGATAASPSQHSPPSMAARRGARRRPQSAAPIRRHGVAAGSSVASATTQTATAAADGASASPPQAAAWPGAVAGAAARASTPQPQPQPPLPTSLPAGTEVPADAAGVHSPRQDYMRRHDGRTPVKLPIAVPGPAGVSTADARAPPVAQQKQQRQQQRQSQEDRGDLCDVHSRSMVMVRRMNAKREALFLLRRAMLEKICVTSVDDATLLRQIRGQPAESTPARSTVDAAHPRSLLPHGMDELVARAQVTLQERSLRDLQQHVQICEDGHSGSRAVTPASMSTSAVQHHVLHAAPHIDFSFRSQASQTDPVSIACCPHAGVGTASVRTAFPPECFAFRNSDAPGGATTGDATAAHGGGGALLGSGRVIVLVCEPFHQRLSVTLVPLVTNPHIFTAPQLSVEHVLQPSLATTDNSRAPTAGVPPRMDALTTRMVLLAQATAARYFRARGGGVSERRQVALPAGDPGATDATAPLAVATPRSATPAAGAAAELAVRSLALFAQQQRQQQQRQEGHHGQSHSSGTPSVGGVPVVSPTLKPGVANGTPLNQPPALPASTTHNPRRPQSATAHRRPVNTAVVNRTSCASPDRRARLTPRLSISNNPYRLLKAAVPSHAQSMSTPTSVSTSQQQQQQQPGGAALPSRGELIAPAISRGPSVAVAAPLACSTAATAPVAPRRPQSARSASRAPR